MGPKKGYRIQNFIYQTIRGKDKISLMRDVDGSSISDGETLVWNDTTKKFEGQLSYDRGYYATPAALNAAIPVGQAGWHVVVGSTDTIRIWDDSTNAWIDSFLSSAVYLKIDQTTPQTVINGVPRFNLGILGGATSNKTDFPLSNSVFSTGDTGHTYAHPIGLVGESVSGSDAGNTATGVGGVASTNGPGTARGVVGVGKVTASADTGASVGVRGRAIDTHIGDSNIGVYSTAQNGLTNYSFYGAAGDIYNINGNISGLGLFSYKPDIKNEDGINGVSLINDTPADVVNTIQRSPGIYLKGNQRDTDDAVNRTSEWRLEVVPISGNSTSSTFRFRSSQNGSTYISPFGVSSGGNISCTGALTTTTGVNSPIANMETTSTVGIYTYSSSAATAAIPVRYSPAFHIAGRAWNTTATAASNILQFRQEVRPVSGATTSASYYWSFDNNGGGYTDIMNLSSTGALTTLSSITTPRAFTVTNGIITTTSDPGLNMVCSANASTTYPVRYSPSIYMTAKAWNTTATAASNSINFKEEVRPVSGATTSGSMYWSFDNNGGGYGDIMSLSSTGVLNVVDKICVGTAAPVNQIDVVKSTNSGLEGTFPVIAARNTLVTQGDGVTTYNFSAYNMSAGNGAVKGLFLASYASDAVYGSEIQFRTSTNHGQSFWTNNARRITVTAAGLVGIGAATPLNSLVVRATSPSYSMEATGFAHDFATAAYCRANSYFSISPWGSSSGGGLFTGITNATSQGALNFWGVSNSQTGTTLTVAPLVFVGQQRGTTSTIAVDATNPLLDIYNGTTAWGVPTALLMRVIGNGNMGLGGITAPTARLNIAAGTSSAGTAPIKIAAGTNLATPEAGAIEFDGTNLYFTDSGGTRHTIAVVA